MRICVVGTGYVGLVTGACFAEIGHDVWCVDVDERKIAMLQEGRIPIYEPGLEEIVRRNSSQGRLRFTTSLKEGMESSLFIFIAVGTPPDNAGAADLSYVWSVAREVGDHLESYKVVVTKSTVPVGTTLRVKQIVGERLALRGRADLEFDVAFCPEFLKEGNAVEDFMKPDRIVVGTENNRTAELLKELFFLFTMRENRILTMSIPSAELTKYAANAMLATRISFMNELARFCERAGADVDEVRLGMGSDSRIGSSFLYAGVGYGGSCFPKDVRALIASGDEAQSQFSILKAVDVVNREQREWFLQKILAHYGGDVSGRLFAVWGLSFKPQTDDVRESPALYIIPRLVEAGARIRAHDPVATGNARERLAEFEGSVEYVDENYEALEGADALILMTEWPPFRRPDFQRMKELLKHPTVFDGRNQYNPTSMRAAGFDYVCIGRCLPGS
ncbi:MAG: UDP-glucose/GDP-mannose dehydrogenase family protein [Synergistaceae bacterium]|nr:UDP-glucose/GDP-mannose dehydrogenase family protein [Synergistota bacterium]NLM71394.1 UDP-glucose/GDP-mannose dehydrogenase family protein [Synergistaceae bacterium]